MEIYKHNINYKNKEVLDDLIDLLSYIDDMTEVELWVNDFIDQDTNIKENVINKLTFAISSYSKNFTYEQINDIYNVLLRINEFLTEHKFEFIPKKYYSHVYVNNINGTSLDLNKLEDLLKVDENIKTIELTYKIRKKRNLIHLEHIKNF